MADTWGDGAAKVAVGDTVKVWHQFDRRGIGPRDGTVVKIGRKLLHVSDQGQVQTYALDDQRLTGPWSGRYETLDQYAESSRRSGAIRELNGFGVASVGTTQLWSGWGTDQLVSLVESVRSIKAS